MKKFAIILAGGTGKRMKSKLYKVLHPVCGKPMVGHVINRIEEAACDRTVVIVGHGADAVKQYIGDRAEFALQAEQLGTGHAVMQAQDLLGSEDGTTILICGDTPLVTTETIENMLALHHANKAAATVLTADLANPTGYGRVIRNEDGQVSHIVEQKDCTAEEAAVREINTGTYCFDNRKLFAALHSVTNNNAQGEYYLTDVIAILKQQGDGVFAYRTADPAESIGINDRIALAEAEGLMRARIIRGHQAEGVTIIDPSSTYIGAEVRIGADSVIYPGTVLGGQTVIGEDCVIGPQADITDTVIANGVKFEHSVAKEAEVGEQSAIGPYAYLRPGAKVGSECKVGDFVELKNAVLGDRSKVSHLSYVGDAVVGEDVNIGCGAITVNYDGYNKSLTEIGDRAFVGSNVNLIAPVKVGDDAYVVAGSTITNDVPAGDMAIARERQTNKPGYADQVRGRAKARKESKGNQK
ncbi:bifunctional UDP-N-acetylglucosamine diphosphorylase/glucosamine-1-phosphate N-acetyltransferase GlmU [Paenibacillaceae bacterium]|nr:bifunctional UDP-N-acetylglucosamine diphosphorylase/glucosamine-1-phosphate N-acetyltransferase GlmU [Paenibacillaceae bacterium]